MAHVQPSSVEEYNAAYQQNTVIDGFGLGTTTHFPCPFCAAPGFYSATILDTETAMAEAHTCSECGRSGKALVMRSPGMVQFEFVQTSGDDMPAWFTPKIRRVTNLTEWVDR